MWHRTHHIWCAYMVPNAVCISKQEQVHMAAYAVINICNQHIRKVKNRNNGSFKQVEQNEIKILVPLLTIQKQ